MSILVMCPSSSCGQLFSVPESDAGTEVACPACGAAQTIAGDSSGPPPVENHQQQTQMPSPTEVEQDDAALPDLSPLKPDQTDSLAAGGDENTAPPDESPWEDQIDLTPEQYESSAQPATTATEEQTDRAKTDIEEELSNIFDADMPSVLAYEWSASPDSLQPADYGVLENNSVKHIMLATSFIGMAGGLLVGIYCFADTPILAAYVGAGLGWTGGFVLGLVLALAVRTDSSRKQKHTVGSPTTDYLKAGSYALTNKSSIYLITMLLVATNVLFVGVYHLLATFPFALRPFRPILIGLCVIGGFFTFAYCLQFFLSVINKTFLCIHKVPDLPASWGMKNIATGLKGLVLLAVYVLPIFTLPLLPMALLMLTAPGWKSVLNPTGVVWAMRKHAEDFVILWLVLLLWFSGMVLAIVVVTIGLWKLTAMIPSGDAHLIIAPSIFFSVVAAATVGAICCTFCLVMSRCIGLFGQHHSADFVR